jgi:hypothetical protein
MLLLVELFQPTGIGFEFRRVDAMGRQMQSPALM